MGSIVLTLLLNRRIFCAPITVLYIHFNNFTLRTVNHSYNGKKKSTNVV